MNTPHATYRLQINPDFPFSAIRTIIEYLNDLGISHIYASPVFQAREGSPHGYDVVDPAAINTELGSQQEFEDLLTYVHDLGMGWIQDIVPNHMAFDSQNDMLMDLLERGAHSRFYEFFDIDWEHHYDRIRGRVLAPFLGRLYNECLEAGELTLNFDQEGFHIRYYDWRFPLRMQSYSILLTSKLSWLKKHIDSDHPGYINLLGALYSLRNLTEDNDPEGFDTQIRFVKNILWENYQSQPIIQKYIDNQIEKINGTPGEAESFDRLHDLLSQQFYRLSYWKVGSEEINYRRFFSVNELITLRMEQQEVFDYTHQLIADLVERDLIDGIRVDHIDGLQQPTQYLERLRKLIGDRYLVVEKILEPGEPLPEFWPVDGTTGYDALNVINGLFCKKAMKSQYSKMYSSFTGNSYPYHEQVHDEKRLIVDKHLAGDVDNLAHKMVQIAGQYRYGHDFTLYGIRKALVEILTWFPVYRTFISLKQQREKDPEYLDEAIRLAKKSMPNLVREIDFIRQILSLEQPDQNAEKGQWEAVAFRFQQLSGPLMAKGFEDTFLYIYNRLLSLNEVGGSPDSFGVSDIEFHQFQLNRMTDWSQTMNTTSTHDTKRGEDVRARINVLSEIPDEYHQHLIRWAKINQPFKSDVNGNPAPDSNDEYFLYQSLIGTLPFDGKITDEYRKRIRDYAIKAVREAKIHTAWLEHDTDYEEAYLEFIDSIIDQETARDFLEDFSPFQEKIAAFGIWNSFSQVILKYTVPGISDLYQGTELWDLNLVDPDNRRPVDYEHRRSLLSEIRNSDRSRRELVEHLLHNRRSGQIKMYLIHQLLQTRAEYPALLEQSEYIPLKIHGTLRNHVVAFARRNGQLWMVTVIPRFLTGLIDAGELPVGETLWSDTEIELPERLLPGEEIFTGRAFSSAQRWRVAEIFGNFPGAVIVCG